MFVLERQRKGETDFELLWLALIALSAATAVGWLHLGLPTPVCLFHTLTSLPCVTCGGTRCVKSLLAGQVDAAFAWNPLVLLLAAGTALYALYALAVTALRLPRVRLGAFSDRQRRALWIGLALAVAANWIYLVFRFSRGA